MDITNLLEDEDIAEKYNYEYDEFPDKDTLLRFLDDYNIPFTIVVANDEEIAVIENQAIFINLDSEPQIIPSEDFDSFIYEKGHHYQDDVQDYINKKFWGSPELLYHATIEDNVESIQKNGLKTMSDSRGINNRHVLPAVFTVNNHELLVYSGSYGDNIFEINTSAMKNDGYMPLIEKEPSAMEAIAYQILANKIKHYDWEYQIDSSSGEWMDTFIIYDEIPPKYLTLMN